jgi:hypothetical protein
MLAKENMASKDNFAHTSFSFPIPPGTYARLQEAVVFPPQPMILPETGTTPLSQLRDRPASHSNAP